MAKSHLNLVAPATQKRTVTPRRRRNGDLRTREYLTEAEVERLMDAAQGNRHGHRDATMILVAYRHGLRVSELVDLRWDQVDFRTATLHVRRVKQGTPSTHPIVGRRTASSAAAPTRAGPQVAVCVHLRARSTVHHRRLRPDARTSWNRGEVWLQTTPAHVAPRMRLCTRQQRARYEGFAGVPRTQKHSAHSSLY
jgi:integrase